MVRVPAPSNPTRSIRRASITPASASSPSRASNPPLVGSPARSHVTPISSTRKLRQRPCHSHPKGAPTSYNPSIRHISELNTRQMPSPRRQTFLFFHTAEWRAAAAFERGRAVKHAEKARPLRLRGEGDLCLPKLGIQFVTQRRKLIVSKPLFIASILILTLIILAKSATSVRAAVAPSSASSIVSHPANLIATTTACGTDAEVEFLGLTGTERPGAHDYGLLF